MRFRVIQGCASVATSEVLSSATYCYVATVSRQFAAAEKSSGQIEQLWVSYARPPRECLVRRIIRLICYTSYKTTHVRAIPTHACLGGVLIAGGCHQP